MWKNFLIIFIICILNYFTLCSNPITIHVIPHSHDDAGWIWTFEQYYTRTGGSWASVKSILDNMVLSLEDDKDRTFIYVEMAFFTKWYYTQNQDVKLRVKKLLKEGRFEFINGGYVMHDEATTYYQDIIDQMRLGLIFLKSEFDYVPKIGWFIDPFGHSAANAYLLSKMGYEKIVFVRIDYKEKDIRRAEKTLEFIYTPFNEIDSKTRIFTHVTYNHYCNPDGMERFLTDTELYMPQSEIKSRSERVYNDLKKISTGYKHDQVLMMYGCDFSHNARDANFKNVEKIMQYINKNYDDMQIAYSTPSKYFEIISEKVKPDNWPEYKNVDFFPYAEYPYSYWTGYYSSRPYLKGLVRETSDYLVSSSRFLMEYLLYGIKQGDKGVYSFVDEGVNKQFFLRERLAICQHHDAVAGTARELVSQDYIKLLDESINKAKQAIRDSFENLLPIKMKSKVCIFNPVAKTDCQEIILSDKDREQDFYISNPGLDGIYSLSFSYLDSNISITDESNTAIITNNICIDYKIQQSQYYSSPSRLKCKINFRFKFEKSKTIYKLKLLKVKVGGNQKEIASKSLQDLSVQILNTKVKFNSKNLKFTINDQAKDYTFSLSHAFYNSYQGGYSDLRPGGSNPGGAYILSPAEESPTEYKLNKEESYVFLDEKRSFLQISLRFEHSFLHIKLIEKNIFEIETEWDSIESIRNSKGREMVLLLLSDIKNNVKLPTGKISTEIWTDSNGMKLMRRLKDFRQGYKYTVTEKIASNFYPVNYMVSMLDRSDYVYSEFDYKGLDESSRVLSLFNDRAQSVGSLREGELIAIINRYSQVDDWKGLDQSLFEEASMKYLSEKHYVVISNKFDQDLIRNYLHNKPSYFVTMVNNKLRQPKQLLAIMNSSNKSIVSQLIEHSPNVVLNFHILNSKNILVQFINLSEPLINHSKEKDSFSFNKVEGIEYSFVEYKFSGIQNMENAKKIEMNSKISKIEKYELSAQEVRLFKVEFK